MVRGQLGNGHPTALILVRNAVTHDARILREAQTLRGAGFAVLISGVTEVSRDERRLEVEGIHVVRLAPAEALRSRARGLIKRPVRENTSPAAADLVGSGRGALRREARRTRRREASRRLRRLALTGVYYLQGIRLVVLARPSLVHANDYNTMWIGIAAKLLLRSRLIYDCHELWPDRNGRPEWRPWLLACEALFVRAADATITTSPGYAAVISRRHRVPRPVVVRNIPAGPRRPEHAHALGGARQPGSGPRSAIGVYVGGLMPGRGLEQAISALARTERIRLRLIGPGRDHYRRDLHELVQRLGISDRIEMLPAVPPASLVDRIADADFGVLLIQPVCLSYSLTLPNKLFEYAAAGLPMLASDLPVIAGLVGERRLGLITPPGNVERIAEAMQELAEPAVNEKLRVAVQAFSRETTWERERPILESVYTGENSSELRRVGLSYAAYARSSRKRRGWSATNPGNAAIRDELYRTSFALAGRELDHAGAILDAGCGSGWWLERLARDGRITAELHGLELLPDRVASAGRRVPTAAIAAGDVRSLPFEEQTFDVVTLFSVLSSLASAQDVRRSVAEGRRVLQPHGALLIWEPRVPNPLNRHTVFVSGSLLREALSGMAVTISTVTVLPPLARRLGRRTEQLYPRLRRLEAVRTHRLVCARERESA